MRSVGVMSVVIGLGWLVGSGLTLAASPAATAASTPSGHASGNAAKQPAPAVKPIDLNSASKAQLKTLPGIGDAEAARIIAGRPYLSKAEIVTKASIPEGIYVAIKRQVIAVQKTKPAGKA